MHGDKQKWLEAFIKHHRWDGDKAKKIQELEARNICKWLLDLDLQKYDVLEIGCGNGYLGKMIIKELADKKKVFTYHFTDLLEECIDTTKKTLEGVPNGNIKFDTLDVYKINEKIKPRSQGIIISTGFASAASHKDAVPLVSETLREGGILICDFINHLSPILFIMQLPKYILNCTKRSKSYHFGKIGIKKFFRSSNLELLKSKTISFRRNPILCMFKKTA
ncbi:MAG: hypothetical protein ACD_65C00165G0001 [uncultured bacterium]|nr:MAG: hypothetical protein ACD_65C00165G0001 [uncultured bacterium]KKT02171.1 MAG: hypothetical protein UV80_C0005G0016 [Candidatus Peregrinibacteria bacterium GW2011_GWF2_43_17]KKT19641.1 MAG: hypothetical protein UW03_C0015G0017 [Candidatus Peregrinibacteria bacterium GW2011_GWA2_43_8]HAU40067.1 hypothetical protein [Candidatus Peregrinibacteria bacterium]